MNEVEGVRDLVLRYADNVNLYNLDDYPNVFTSDGVWDVQGFFRVEGRETILETFKNLRNKFEWVLQLVQGTRIIQINDKVVKARSYIKEHGVTNGTGYLFICSYHDWCVFDEGSWRFKQRICDPIYSGPPDQMTPLRTYPAPIRF